MKLLIVVLSVSVFAGMILSGLAAEKDTLKATKLRHVVAFKFKEGTTPQQIKQVETSFRDLKKKIATVAEYEWGINNSPENKNRGCTHAFMLTFKSEKDRDEYLPHPAHKEFVKFAGPLLDDVFVIDYWAQD